jgi:hypothetical protein
MNYTGRMDRQCLALCDALNLIPGIETSESCCGHGRHPYWIWFVARGRDALKGLTVVGRVFDRRYGGIEGWRCEVDNHDVQRRCPAFLITSGDAVGRKIYSDSKKIAKNIREHLNHPAFMREFLNREPMGV